MTELVDRLKFVKLVLATNPRYSAVVLLCLIVASLCEGLGLMALVPLLAVVLGEAEASGFASAVNELFALVGLDPTFPVILVSIVVLFVAKAVIVWISKIQVGYATARVGAGLRHELIDAIMAVRWHYYVTKPAGALANAMTLEADAASNAYFQSVRFVADGLMVLVYALLAALIAWEATVAAICAGLVLTLPLQQFVRMARAAGRRQIALLKSTASVLVDRLNGLKALKAMGQEAVLGRILARETDELNNAKRHAVNATEGLIAVQEPFFVIAVVGILYGAVEFLEMEPSLLLMLALLIYRTLGRVGTLQVSLQGIARCEAAYLSIRDAIGVAKDEVETLWGQTPPRLARSIALRDLCFRYDDDAIFTNLNIDVKAGSFTALVGPSGSGKTTLIDMITGLYRPTSGDVWVDDVPLSEIDIAAWRQMIGYVPQEAVLFNDTIRANVTLGNPDLDDDDAFEALRAAGLGDYVESLPDGIDTVVGEKGMRFSGGQRQRIALARALAPKPKLLILDEATSALDRDTERQILQTVCELRGKVTVLAISHQPAVMEAADVVFQIRDGTVKLHKPSTGQRLAATT